MTDERDPLLEGAFAASHQPPLDDETFTAAVVKRARFERLRIAAPWLAVGAVVTVAVWVLAVPLETAHVITRILGLTIVDLGEGWLAWLLAPINNIAAVLAAGFKLVRMARKKVIAASYGR